MPEYLPRIRQPEYTGENRCLPCSVVNVGIATFGSLVIALWSPLLAAAAFLLALVLIYLRGYLVPGTPSLTKRYFPRSVLRWFGKEPAFASNEHEVTIEPEQILIQSDVLTPCETGPDLCLDPDFRASWRDRMLTPDTDHDMVSLRSALHADSDQVTLVEHGDALVASDNEGIIGQWPSPAATVADVAAAAELNCWYSGWDRLSIAEKGRLLMSLRVFLEVCPNCGGTVRLEQEVVESCCQSYDVALSACQGCDAKLFEIEWQDEFAQPEHGDDTGRPATA